MTELVKYDAMCRAISACHKVDEVKDIRAKAKALAAYQHQAQNFEAERECQQIRIRAERRCGELLKEISVAKGGQPYQSRGARGSPHVTKTLAQLGITADQSSDWKKLAEIPDKEFETSLVAMDKPTTSGMLRICETRTADSSSREPTVITSDTTARMSNRAAKEAIWKLGWVAHTGGAAAQVAEMLHRELDQKKNAYQRVGLAFALAVAEHLRDLEPASDKKNP